MSYNNFMCIDHGLNEDADAELLNPTLENRALLFMLSK